MHAPTCNGFSFFLPFFHFHSLLAIQLVEFLGLFLCQQGLQLVGSFQLPITLMSVFKRIVFLFSNYTEDAEITQCSCCNVPVSVPFFLFTSMHSVHQDSALLACGHSVQYTSPGPAVLRRPWCSQNRIREKPSFPIPVSAGFAINFVVKFGAGR